MPLNGRSLHAHSSFCWPQHPASLPSLPIHSTPTHSTDPTPSCHQRRSVRPLRLLAGMGPGAGGEARPCAHHRPSAVPSPLLSSPLLLGAGTQLIFATDLQTRLAVSRLHDVITATWALLGGEGLFVPLLAAYLFWWVDG